MTKLTKLLFVSLFMISSLFAMDKISNKELKEIQKLPLFSMAQVQINGGVDAGTFYALNVVVRGNSDRIFLSKDKKYIIPGDVISTQTGKPLQMAVNLKPTLNKEAFTFGTGKDEYVLFTDPECPFCKKFESYFSQIKDKVKFKVFLFPLTFHKHAKPLSLYILSKKSNDEKVKALLETNKDTKAFVNRKFSKAQKEKLEKTLDEQMDIATKLGVRGTPTLFDKAGYKLSWVEVLEKYGVTVK